MTHLLHGAYAYMLDRVTAYGYLDMLRFGE